MKRIHPVVWAVVALTGCATSKPEPASKPARQVVLPDGHVETLPERGTVTVGKARHTCLIDGEVSSVDRQPAEAAALSFMTAALGANPGEAYAMMAPEARAVSSTEAFAAGIRAIERQSGQFRDVRLAHTYFIESSGEGAAESAVCDRLGGHRWISFALKPAHKQAYVTISARTQNSDWDLIVWLYPAAGKWTIGWFDVGVDSLAGHSAADVLQLARNERKAGHDLNAILLYVAVRTLIDRGPNVRLAIADDAEKDFATVEVPPEVRGSPPFTWKLGGKEYTVASASIIGVEGKLGLIFMLPSTTWDGEAAADEYNREFLTGFIAAHPEYSRVFEFLVARALVPDKSTGFGTVYKVGQGFGKPPAVD